MKLLFITTDITIVGGIERVISKISKSLIENYNYEIEIISLYKNRKNGHKTNFKFHHNIKISYCDIEYDNKVSRNKLETLILLIRRYYRLIKDVRKVIKSIDTDIVITFHTPISIAAILNKKYIDGKLIVTEHSEYDNYPDKISKLLRKLLFKKSNKVVVLTELSKKRYEKFTNNVVVIPNPLSFESNEVSSLNNNRIIAAGRLEVEKGFDLLIQAFKQIYNKNKQWSLDIFGCGGEYENLINLIKELKLDSNVRIYPFTKNLKEEMLKSDICVIPSRSESFSLVAIEAMECGIPCISFDTNGPTSILRNNIDGIIVKKDNIELFGKKLDYLMNNIEIRLEYGKNAKKEAKKFHISKIAEKWNNLINNA